VLCSDDAQAAHFLDAGLSLSCKGTSIIAGPPYAINPVIEKIGHVAPDCSNRHTLPEVWREWIARFLVLQT
jgi:hypothetical protein